MDRILNMVVRRIVGRLVNKGVDAGVGYVARKSSGTGEPAELTPEQNGKVRQTQRNARQAMRLARRFGRF